MKINRNFISFISLFISFLKLAEKNWNIFLISTLVNNSNKYIIKSSQLLSRIK